MILDYTTKETGVAKHTKISWYLTIKCQSCDQMQIVISAVAMFFSIIAEVFS